MTLKYVSFLHPIFSYANAAPGLEIECQRVLQPRRGDIFFVISIPPAGIQTLSK